MAVGKKSAYPVTKPNQQLIHNNIKLIIIISNIEDHIQKLPQENSNHIRNKIVKAMIATLTSSKRIKSITQIKKYNKT